MKKISLILLLSSVIIFANAQQKTQPTPVLEPNDSMALFKVFVCDMKGNPYKSDIVSFVSQSTNKVYSGKSATNGRFELLLPKGQTYNVQVRIIGKDTTMRSIQVPSQPERITFEYTFKYQPPQTIKLDRVYFDTNKSTLKPESMLMLNDLFEFLSNKPSINIEIAGHTDNVGGADFNQKLSQNRANAVFNYLVKKGIDPKRIWINKTD
jgi:outer membrane protein OmpA-like peptidoglycan-associated protein